MNRMSFPDKTNFEVAFLDVPNPVVDVWLSIAAFLAARSLLPNKVEISRTVGAKDAQVGMQNVRLAPDLVSEFIKEHDLDRLLIYAGKGHDGISYTLQYYKDLGPQTTLRGNIGHPAAVSEMRCCRRSAAKQGDSRCSSPAAPKHVRGACHSRSSASFSSSPASTQAVFVPLCPRAIKPGEINREWTPMSGRRRLRAPLKTRPPPDFVVLITTFIRDSRPLASIRGFFMCGSDAVPSLD